VIDEIVATNYANHDPAAPMPESGREGQKKTCDRVSHRFTRSAARD
jgi:hypothetical protein